MAITFTINRNERYYIASFSGRITDDEMLSEYKKFFETGDWSPDLNALVDFGDSDLDEVTSLGMRLFAQQVAAIARKNNWKPKVAVCAQGKLQYGLSRMYSKNVESYEEFSVFRSRDEAIAWLCGT